MRIPIRTSRLAIWSRRFGSFALPLMLVPIVMHRERFITSPSFHATELLAAVIAALAVLLGLGALVRLWFSGDRGWSRALSGIAAGAIVLLPVAWLGWNAMRYPTVTEVSTDFVRPPALSGPMLPVVWTPQLREQVALVFPGAVTRTYALTADEAFALIERLVAERGWEVRQRRAPVGPLGEGQLNVISLTLFGWREEAAIRAMSTPQGARIDMRSASPPDLPLDFGSNGARIEEFLTVLDGLANPAATAPQLAPAPEEEPAPAVEGDEPDAEPAAPPKEDDAPVPDDNEPVEG